jgi:hypothetical protein
MQREGLLLLVHGEVTSSDVDLFDREAVFIDAATHSPAARFSWPEDRDGAHHNERGCALCAAAGDAHCCHHHRAPPSLQPQRHVHRGHPAALLLPARTQARDAPPGAGRSGHLGAITRFFLGTDSAPHAAHLKEHAAGALVATPPMRPSSCTPRLLTPQVRWTSLKALPVSSGPTSMACRAIPTASACAVKIGHRRRASLLARPNSSLCARARACPGAW